MRSEDDDRWEPDDTSLEEGGKHKPDRRDITITGRAIKKDGGLTGIVRGSLIQGHMRVIGISRYFTKTGTRTHMHKPFFYGDQEDLIANFNDELPAHIQLVDDTEDHALRRNARMFRRDKKSTATHVERVSYRDKFLDRRVEAAKAYYLIPCDALHVRKQQFIILVEQMWVKLNELVASFRQRTTFAGQEFSHFPLVFTQEAVKAGMYYKPTGQLSYSLPVDECGNEPALWDRTFAPLPERRMRRLNE